MAPTQKPNSKSFRTSQKETLNIHPGSPALKVKGKKEEGRKVKGKKIRPTLKTRPLAPSSKGKKVKVFNFKDLETLRVIVK